MSLFSFDLLTFSEYGTGYLAALIALKPMSYVIRLGMAIGAFFTAINVDSVIGRAISLVWLGLVGAMFLVVGITQGTVVDILLGIAGLGAAGYAWWFTRM